MLTRLCVFMQNTQRIAATQQIYDQVFLNSLCTRGLFYWHGLPEIRTWISNHTPEYFVECHHTYPYLTHYGRVTHICVAKVTIIGSDNGLSPGRRQAIIWTNAGILLIGPLVGTNFSEILIGTFSFKKMHLKMSSAKWRLFCLGLNVLTSKVVLEVTAWMNDYIHLIYVVVTRYPCPKLIAELDDLYK